MRRGALRVMSDPPRDATRERVGLCATCRHARQVPTPKTLYWLCGLAATDPRFDRYPRLPVVACGGYRRDDAEPPAG